MTFARIPDIIFCMWLDRDKAKESIRQSAWVRQYIPKTVTIITPKDPKCYTDEEINEFVSGATKGVSKPRTVE